MALFVGASAAQAADPFDIPVIAPLTGAASFAGKSGQVAVQLAEDQINKDGGVDGRPVRFVFQDDQTSPQTAVQLTNRVMAAKPAVIIGSWITAMCNAMSPLAQKNGPLIYCISPATPTGDYTFSAGTSTRDQLTALVAFFRAKGWTRIAVLTATDATGQDAERNVDYALGLPENKSIEVTARLQFRPTDVSVSAQIQQIKATSPQVLLTWTIGPSLATVLKAMQQADLNIPAGTTSANLNYAFMAQFAAVLPKELYIPSSVASARGGNLVLDPEVKRKRDVFYAAFDAKGVKPDVAAEVAWDPVMIVVDAYRKLGTGASAEQIRDHVGGLTGYAGVSGVYDFRRTPQRGLSIDNVVVTRWNADHKLFDAVSGPAGAPLAP